MADSQRLQFKVDPCPITCSHGKRCHNPAHPPEHYLQQKINAVKTEMKDIDLALAKL